MYKRMYEGYKNGHITFKEWSDCVNYTLEKMLFENREMFKRIKNV